MKIFINLPLSEGDKQFLSKNLAGHELYFAFGQPNDLIKKEFRLSEVAFGMVESDWITKDITTKWIQLNSVGFDHLLSLDWGTLAAKIRVTNVAGLFSVPVAETTIAGLLSLYRGINQLSLLKENCQWVGAPMRQELSLLSGKQCLIVGGGSIGQTIGKFLKAFNCHVSFYDRYLPTAKYQSLKAFDEALPESDILVFCIPETPETKNLLDEDRIARLKRTCIVINVGRGGVIDEPALIHALSGKSIGGAVLDVTWKEPIPKDHPLWDCPNTMLTQHTGGGTHDESLRKAKVFVENFALYIAGDTLNYTVDFNRGY